MALKSASGDGRGSAPRATKPKAEGRVAWPSPAAKELSASASSTVAAGEASTLPTVAAVLAPTPAPGPIKTALRRPSPRNSPTAASLPHAGGQRRRIDGGRCRRADDGDKPGTDAQRAARSHAGGTRALRRSRHHHRMAAPILVAVDPRPGIGLTPLCRSVEPGVGPDL